MSWGEVVAAVEAGDVHTLETAVENGGVNSADPDQISELFSKAFDRCKSKVGVIVTPSYYGHAHTTTLTRLARHRPKNSLLPTCAGSRMPITVDSIEWTSPLLLLVARHQRSRCHLVG